MDERSAERLRARRARLMEQIGSGVAVLAAQPEAVRSNDTHHRYRPANDVLYFAGFAEPEAVAVIAPRHPEHRFVLFCRKRDPEREVWDGARAGVEGALADFGADAAFPIDELEARLPDYLKGAEELHYAIGHDEAMDRRVLRALAAARAHERRGALVPWRVVDPAVSTAELRLRKDADELARMRRAAAPTVEAHLEAMRRARPGAREFEIEALLVAAFRRHGGEPAYTPIVAAGANATVLHYVDNRAELRDGELLLIDAGAELDWYASDVTRTFPIGRRFSPEQRAIYDLVLTAQQEAIARARPGETIDGIHAHTVDVLVDGLLALGLLAGERGEIIERQRYRRFYMHRTSHWLGLDVHDVGRYFVAGRPRPLEPGMVLTVEPGIYVQPGPDVEPRWHGIGVRIEDDVVVTAGAPEVLTAEVPRAAADLERLAAERP